ncbi:ferrous iron transport protein B [Tenacibaculum jejuense]|uniref:Ferrous iron transport protein B n=1 Tax=Tenacibaculum jejuense TaxID=584609 RepID=A0A238UGV3_9FLAO|nr:ferrous iron transport protein B [Tenacibaculum jejuense]SNR17634.1 Ferrous iron transport protein B [Tenacibaculum jejuense]
MEKNNIQVSLIGNPNTGKTSLFNKLTGLNQKVGNYPGITVDKKQGVCNLSSGNKAIITDLPGTYSINPTSLDESVVLKVLQNTTDENYPDVIVVVADVENLKRNLLLFSQIQDIGVPTILAINMADEMDKKGISIDISGLEKALQTKVVLVSAKKNQGIQELKNSIATYENLKKVADFSEIANKIDRVYFETLQKVKPHKSLYDLWLGITQQSIDTSEKQEFANFLDDISKLKKYQHKETIYRYQRINNILKENYNLDISKAKDLRSKLDKIFTHKIFGYFIFLSVLVLMFQSIYEWASIPMDFIDNSFGSLVEYTKSIMPEGMFTDLLTDGIIAGIGGVVIFIPQIAILYFLVAFLEESGYMSRVVFLMDKIMRRFGMSGKSIVPLISGTACAIPAVMATRTISSWKERLITILVTPFTTCAARLPVYAILIAIIIPDKKVLGFLNLQGLTLLALYALGFFTAIISAYVLHKILKIKSKSFFVMEMPEYKLPSFKNIIFTVLEKTKTFVVDAGKVILAISIVLWFLATHGPSSYDKVEEEVRKEAVLSEFSEEEIAQKIASKKLEKSYIGIAGKTIEPIVKPLGFDWKIGIGLITSFAAREVFVGTLATIYSIEGVEEEATIKERMEAEINPDTGKKRFNFATGMSLLVFYAFAMQCMATLAIVKRETNSWKWPLIQLFGMGILAYVSALITFQALQ